MPRPLLRLMRALGFLETTHHIRPHQAVLVAAAPPEVTEREMTSPPSPGWIQPVRAVASESCQA